MKSLERYIVAKFGGWSLANAERTRIALAYVQSNPDIHYVVPSAPGAVKEGDKKKKVTDYLISCCELRKKGQAYQASLDPVSAQFTEIANDLSYPNMAKLLGTLEQGLATNANDAWVRSRGEAINGRMWADLLDIRFIDPTELIRFRKNGQLNECSYNMIRSRLRGRDRFVIPGFYGLGADGEVKTFPRDGSDVTGSVIARGVNASIYLNLTSADGVLSADPNIVTNPGFPRLIETMTFNEYRELGNGGVKVLHRDTIIPVAKAGIPINVRHSLKPDSRGTMVVNERSDSTGGDVIGIAGRSGFVSFNIHKYGMNEERGIEGRILNIIRKAGISVDYTPSENDRISVVFNGEQLGTNEDQILDSIREKIRPQSLELQRNVGFISVVGQGIRENRTRVARTLFSVLDDKSIQHSGITNALSGISIIVFVNGEMVEDAIKAAHAEFIEK